MNLASSRTLEAMRPVLQNPKSHGPDPVYWVYANLTKDQWANLTVIAPGFFSPDLVPESGELPKTFGHYHTKQVNEIYHLIDGEGILFLQKKHRENEKWIPEIVDEVVLVKAKAGNELLITPEWGHAWINTGNNPLLSYDNWREGHVPQDYEMIEKLKGMAYYLTLDNGRLNLIPNSNYKNLPQPTWLDATAWQARQRS